MGWISAYGCYWRSSEHGRLVCERRIRGRGRRAHHGLDERKGTLLAINCAALPADILDAELFGHAKGAYTGAYRDRPGLIEAANDGTLFLDEIGEMSLAVQGRLLRAIEAKEIRRLGENHPRSVSTRFVGATHRDLNQMVKEGS